MLEALEKSKKCHIRHGFPCTKQPRSKTTRRMEILPQVIALTLKVNFDNGWQHARTST